MPRNQFRANKMYEEGAGVFGTSGNKLRIPLREAMELGLDPRSPDARPPSPVAATGLGRAATTV